MASNFGRDKEASPNAETYAVTGSAPDPYNDMSANFARNKAWTKSDAGTEYTTSLPATDEAKFRQWVTDKKVAFDPAAKISDYDMRGFWKALQTGDPIAKSAIDPNDNRLHYPDYWKTPYHQTFSNESQWADPAKAPKWTPDDKLVAPDGTIIFDDRANKQQQSPEFDFKSLYERAMAAAQMIPTLRGIG